MPFEAVLERQAALMSGACRLSLREVDCSAQAIEATETATLQRLALLFAPELMVASATLGDGGRSVRLEKSDGRALLGAVSPMVELVMQECTSSGGCYIGAALPDKGALSCYLGEDAGSWGYRADGVIKHKGFRVQSGLPTYKAGDRIRMTLAGGVLAWHINGQRAAEVRGVPSGVHFGVSRFDSGTVEVRIERASVAGAVGCSAMLRPLCALMGREGNALRTVRLGGNGAWAEGDGSTLAAALGAASCVVAELDVSGSGLGADEAVALVSAGCALQTLRLGEWAIPVGELRSGESMSTIGQAVGEAEGAVVGALLKASTSLSTLDLIAPASARRTGAHLDLVDPTSGAAPAGGGFGAAPSPFGGSAAAAPAFGAVTMPEVGTSSPYGATLAFGGVIAASAPSAGGGGFGGAAVAPGTEATAIRDAHSLTAWLLAQHGAQLEGGPTEGPLAALLTAGPASGKTTLLSQVVMIALLDERTELVPILVKVQVLQRRLLEAPDAFAGAWNFIDAFLRLEHEASRPALYRMLRQAMMARRALLLLDGLDEAGTKRDDIERHVVDVLAPQGHVLLCTSRPAGVDEARFAAFRRLALAPLSDEQQERALEQRLGAERAAALLTYVRDVMPRDDTGQKVTSNPLMLSMVASVYELRQGVGMPATVAELYATASDAMLARGGVATPELTRLLQRIFFEAHVAQRRLIEDRQLDEAALGLEAPEALAKIRAEAAMMPFEPFNGRAEMGHYVEVTKEGEHKGRRGVITTDQESRHVYYQVTFANGTVSGWLKPNELRSSGLVGEVAALQRAMDASAPAVRAECETRLSVALREALRTVRERVLVDALPLLSLWQSEPLQLQSSHLSFQEYFAAIALCDEGTELSGMPPWQWPVWWANAVKLGAEIPGDRFGRGLLRAAGVTGDTLDLSQKLGGDRPTVWRVLAAVVANASELRTLNLSQNKLDAEDARALAPALMKTTAVLTKLSLWGNNIGSDGAKAIAEALKVNAVVTTLDLGRNKIGDEGAKAIAEALKVNAVVTTLYLYDNNIGPEGAMAIAEALKVNAVLTSVDLRFNSIGDVGAMAIAEALKVNAVVTTLDLGDNRFGDEGAKAIAEALKVNAVLTELWLNGNNIGPEGAIAIAEALKVNAVLTELLLRANEIGDVGAKAIAEALKVNAVLKNCNLLENSLDIESATMLAKIGAERGIMLSGMKRDQTEANLSSKGLRSADAILIGSDLQFMAVLTELSLFHNNIGDNGAKAIAEALKVNAVVTELFLYSNSIGDEGAVAIAEALKVNAVMKNISVAYSNIVGEAAQQLAAAALGSLSLEVLSGVPIKELREDKLTELNLRSNGLGSTEGIVLAELIKFSAVLTNLDLKWNNIGDEGAIAIAEALKVNAVLTKLNLKYNSMGDAGEKAVRDTVKDRSGFELEL
jgi:Ran GTPase-activating protein (RanGAP) involved in mRNA processing and transport